MIDLPPEKFELAAEALELVEINHLFARSVLERRMDGRVHVDRMPHPRVFYVRHPYGMSLVYGNATAFAEWSAFWDELKGTASCPDGGEWLQAWPESLSEEMTRHASAGPDQQCAMSTGPALEIHTRVNFKFDPSAFSNSSAEAEDSPHDSRIVRTGAAEYAKISGSVVPGYFWRDRSEFLGEGIGFSLLKDGVVASTAFSAFKYGNQLELGIETHRNYQGRGYAYAVCRELIAHCLKSGFEPVWACRLENVGSVKLAQKLGFNPTLHIPYFRIKIPVRR